MRFYVIKSKAILFVGLMFCVMALLTINVSGAPLASVFFYASNRKIPIYCVDRDDKQIALSFDAAWGSDKTESILGVLDKFNIKATFFLVGMWVDKNEELIKLISNKGHEIGTHTNLHPDLTKLDSTQINLELSVSKKKIEDITSKPVTLFRCPYGAYNNKVISEAENLNLKTIQWDVDTLEWKGISAQKITSNAITKVKSGSIILCHNNSDNIVEALPGLISSLIARGYIFNTIGNILYQDNFTIDKSGKQIKNWVNNFFYFLK